MTVPKHCLQCGTAFHPTRRWQRFCSAPCRIAYHAEARNREFVRASRVLEEGGYTEAAQYLKRSTRDTALRHGS